MEKRQSIGKTIVKDELSLICVTQQLSGPCVARASMLVLYELGLSEYIKFPTKIM